MIASRSFDYVKTLSDLSRVGLDALSPVAGPGRRAMIRRALAGIDTAIGAARPWLSRRSRPLAPGAAMAQPRIAALYGAFWSRSLLSALERLEAVQPDRLLHVFYDELVDAPAPTFGRIARFAGVAPVPDWIDRVARTPRRRAPKWHALDDAMREALVRACEPGMAALQRLRVATVPMKREVAIG